MANVVYLSKTLLTGGTAPALDSIDGTGLVDGDFAHVNVSDVLYIYRLNATSGAGESSPTIIAPDTNAGTKRWILRGVNANGMTNNSLTASLPLFTGASKELVSKSVADTQTALAIPAEGAWTDYFATSTIVGWAAGKTGSIWYKVVGKIVFVVFNITGTSDDAGISFTTPSNSSASLNFPITYQENNGVGATGGRGAQSNNLVACYRDAAVTAWTTSGTKRVTGQFFYLIA